MGPRWSTSKYSWVQSLKQRRGCNCWTSRLHQHIDTSQISPERETRLKKRNTMTEQKTAAPALSSDVTEVRAQKLALLRQQIGAVYPAHFHRTITNAELAEKYADLELDTESGDIVTVAGRVYSSRNSGMFMDIHDASGKIQIFSHKDTTPEEARALLPMIDIGDIIGVTGVVRRTKRGELTINAQDIVMLTKTLLPMPE